MRIFAFFVVLVASTSAHADCKRANLKSGGVSISIHYSSFAKSNGDTAWIYAVPHVRLPIGKCTATRVDVVFVQAPSFAGGHGNSETVSLKRVSLRGCDYVANAPVAVGIQSHAGKPDQQIAVHIGYQTGEEWLTDPVNGSHNFNYKIFASYDPTNEVCW